MTCEHCGEATFPLDTGGRSCHSLSCAHERIAALEAENRRANSLYRVNSEALRAQLNAMTDERNAYRSQLTDDTNALRDKVAAQTEALENIGDEFGRTVAALRAEVESMRVQLAGATAGHSLVACMLREARAEVVDIRGALASARGEQERLRDERNVFVKREEEARAEVEKERRYAEFHASQLRAEVGRLRELCIRHDCNPDEEESAALQPPASKPVASREERLRAAGFEDTRPFSEIQAALGTPVADAYEKLRSEQRDLTPEERAAIYSDLPSLYMSAESGGCPVVGDAIEVFSGAAWRAARVDAVYKAAGAFGWAFVDVPNSGGGATDFHRTDVWRWECVDCRQSVAARGIICDACFERAFKSGLASAEEAPVPEHEGGTCCFCGYANPCVCDYPEEAPPVPTPMRDSMHRSCCPYPWPCGLTCHRCGHESADEPEHLAHNCKPTTEPVAMCPMCDGTDIECKYTPGRKPTTEGGEG